MRRGKLILGVGELLWDVLPDGQQLGGAPANFAVMAGRLGDHAVILSRIGRDELGREAVERLEPLPVDASYLQTDAAQETGRVTVAIEEGQPSYTIHQPAAWDFMEASEGWQQLAAQADAICFGSLAQRSDQSRQTIQALVARSRESCVRIFDVNLRAPFFSGEVIRESLELATVVKMNDAEAPQVLALLGLAVEDSLLLAARRLLAEFPALQLVAVTRGAHGSLLVSRNEAREHPGFTVKVADTIGAGDAFTAALARYLLRGASLATLNEAGNRWGAWAALQQGGMAEVSEEARAGITAKIEE